MSAVSRSKPLKIAIVGSGIGGLASALYLDRLGHDVTIFERFSSPRPIGSGLMLQPTGLAVLADLGLDGAILKLGQKITRLEGVDAESHRRVLDVHYTGSRFGLAVHRTALFNVLNEAATGRGIMFRTSSEIDGTRRIGDAIELVGVDGRSVGNRFDIVVDAAGTGSPLVPAHVRGTKQLDYGAFWATLDWPADAPFHADALQQRYRSASVMIGVLPVNRQTLRGDPKVAFFWSLKREDVALVRENGIDTWKQRVRDLWPETDVLLDQIGSFDDLTFAAYGHHTLAAPADDRLFHIGDSYHATSPQLGQGANMALLDAAALGSAFQNGGDLRDAARAYKRMRHTHVRTYQALSLWLTPFYQSDSATIAIVRDTLVATAARVPPMPFILSKLVAGDLIDPLKPVGLAPFVDGGREVAASSERLVAERAA